MEQKNDLKRLKRKELLEILLEQTKRIEELEDKLDILQKELNSKNISINQSGSLAEASLKLSNIFKSADDAIEIYRLNFEQSLKKEERLLKKECKKIRDKMISDTNIKCKKKEEESEKKVKKLEKQVEKLEKKIVKLTKESSNRKIDNCGSVNIENKGNRDD